MSELNQGKEQKPIMHKPTFEIEDAIKKIKKSPLGSKIILYGELNQEEEFKKRLEEEGLNIIEKYPSLDGHPGTWEYQIERTR